MRTFEKLEKGIRGFDGAPFETETITVEPGEPFTCGQNSYGLALHHIAPGDEDNADNFSAQSKFIWVRFAGSTRRTKLFEGQTLHYRRGADWMILENESGVTQILTLTIIYDPIAEIPTQNSQVVFEAQNANQSGVLVSPAEVVAPAVGATILEIEEDVMQPGTYSLDFYISGDAAMKFMVEIFENLVLVNRVNAYITAENLMAHIHIPRVTIDPSPSIKVRTNALAEAFSAYQACVYYRRLA